MILLGWLVVIIIISIIVSIITEQLLIRRLRLEEGIVISKGKCMLKKGYGLITPEGPSSVNSSQRFNHSVGGL